eukprot:124352-Pleurochrysis_carterae.AAC.1
MESGSQVAVAFDDLNWRSYPSNTFSKEFSVITDDEQDNRANAVRSVLLGRKGSLNLPSGYLLDASAATCKPTPL